MGYKIIIIGLIIIQGLNSVLKFNLYRIHRLCRL